MLLEQGCGDRIRNKEARGEGERDWKSPEN